MMELREVRLFADSFRFIFCQRNRLTWSLGRLKYEKTHKNIEKSGTILFFQSLNIQLIYVWLKSELKNKIKSKKKYIIGLQKIKMVPDFSMFLWVFSDSVLATPKPTHQKIAKVRNVHSSLAKVPVSYFNLVKIAFCWTHQLWDWFWPSFCSSFLKILVRVDR